MKSWMALFAACAFTVGAASCALAQVHPQPGCGSRQGAEDELESFAMYFHDDEYAAVRGTVLQKLSNAEPQAVVTDVGTCRAVLQAALRVLRQHDSNWPAAEARGYDFTVLRYGPYYAILVKVSDDPVTGPAHYLPLMVFRARGLTYLTTILV